MERERTYVCIDLKSFYASVECVRRGLDPMTTRLVVADPTRSEMTICLAVSPAMKAAGVKNRCRLYEIPEGIDYITAQPRMTSYMEVSAEIYGTYLRYVSQEDIHPYSIDECFIDATPYLELYDLTAREFADTLRSAVRARRASRPPWASAPTCSSRRWRSTSRQARAGRGGRARCAPFARASGGIGPSPTFGTSGRALLGGSRSTGCSI
ncbi:MAG: hypothetical protein ACLUVF_04595 [Adlercreutzia sp.]